MILSEKNSIFTMFPDDSEDFTMKKTIASVISVLTFLVFSSAQEHVSDSVYISLVKDCRAADFSLSDCLAFLEKYPESRYSDEVSDLVCEYYMSVLRPSSPEIDIDNAFEYSASDSLQLRLTKYTDMMGNISARYRRKHMWEGRIQMGFGGGYEMWNNTAAGIRTEIRLGRLDDLVSLSAGLGVKFWNMVWTRSSRYSYIRYTQFPFHAGVSVNTFWLAGARIYAGGEMAYNLHGNNASCVHPEERSTDFDSSHLGRYFTLSGRIGLRSGTMDISIYYIYDLEPPLDQKYIYESSGLDYKAFGPTVNDRFRIGITLMFYIGI